MAKIRTALLLALFVIECNFSTHLAHAAGSAKEGKASALDGVVSFIRSKNGEISSYSVDAQAFTNNILNSKDKIYFKQPSHVRWEEYHPGSKELRSILIANGRDCFLYEPESKTLKKWPCQWEKAGLRAIPPFLDFPSPEGEMKLIKDRRGERKSAYVIEAIDKKDSDNRNLWTISRGYFDRQSGLLIKLVLLGGYGDVRSETVFENYNLNVPLDDSLFAFTPPPDTKIIEGEG